LLEGEGGKSGDGAEKFAAIRFEGHSFLWRPEKLAE